MQDDKSGGSAFPYGVKRTVRDGYGDGERVIDENEPGMSLRDYFAAAALQGILASAYSPGDVDADTDDKACAECAYRTADAMLKERAK